tara:strand:- start:65 stop:442 length:378 start_codon:yes stop_codon:yes gene_type:complete
MNLIKKYLGIVGFLLALIGISIAALYKFYGTDMEPLGEISFFVWITTWTISSEINKEKPKKWWVYTVTNIISCGNQCYAFCLLLKISKTYCIIDNFYCFYTNTSITTIFSTLERRQSLFGTLLNN